MNRPLPKTSSDQGEVFSTKSTLWMKFAIRRADTPNDAIYRKWYTHAMKSALRQEWMADLISSEAKAEDFI